MAKRSNKDGRGERDYRRREKTPGSMYTATSSANEVWMGELCLQTRGQDRESELVTRRRVGQQAGNAEGKMSKQAGREEKQERTKEGMNALA